MTSASGEDVVDCERNESPGTTPLPVTSKEADFSSEEKLPRITELLNPMSWFKKTHKENAFEINAELGTVRELRRIKL